MSAVDIGFLVFLLLVGLVVVGTWVGRIVRLLRSGRPLPPPLDADPDVERRVREQFQRRRTDQQRRSVDEARARNEARGRDMYLM